MDNEFRLKPLKNSNSGIVYIVFGKEYEKNGVYSAKSVVEKSRFPIHVITNIKQKDRDKNWPKKITFQYLNLPNSDCHLVKTKLIYHTPFDYTFHLDADTLVSSDKAFVPLDYLENWDMCIVTWDNIMPPSDKQGWENIANVLRDNRHFILCSGIFFFKKNDRMRCFFDIWNKDYIETSDNAREEGAMCRSIWNSDIRILYLPGKDIWIAKHGDAYIWHNYKGDVPGLPKIIKYKPNGKDKNGKKTVWKAIKRI